MAHSDLVYSVKTPIVEQVYSAPQLNKQATYVSSQINQNPTTVKSHSINQDSYSSILKTMGTEEMLNVFDNSLVHADPTIEVIESDIVTNGDTNIDTTLVSSNLQLEESLVTAIILENDDSSIIENKDAYIAPVKVAFNSIKEQHKKSTKRISRKPTKLNSDLNGDEDLNFIIIREVKPAINEDLYLSDESRSEEVPESNLFADSEENNLWSKEKRLNIMEYTVVEPQPNFSFDSMPMFETEDEHNNE